MNHQDVFYVGKILYRSTNNSKICPKLPKPTDRMGRIWTAYLLCTRITLETTALRVMWEKCVQILYSSINTSKSDQIHQPIDWLSQIQTAYFLCTRITLETTALRVM